MVRGIIDKEWGGDNRMEKIKGMGFLDVII